MVLVLFIFNSNRLVSNLLNSVEHLFVFASLLLLEVDVFIRCFQRLHARCDLHLHLQWVEVPLEYKHVAKGALHVLQLCKLSEKQVRQRIEVLFHVLR